MMVFTCPINWSYYRHKHICWVVGAIFIYIYCKAPKSFSQGRILALVDNKILHAYIKCIQELYVEFGHTWSKLVPPNKGHFSSTSVLLKQQIRQTMTPGGIELKLITKNKHLFVRNINYIISIFPAELLYYDSSSTFYIRIHSCTSHI